MQPKVFEDKKRYRRKLAAKWIAIGVMAAILILLALLKLSVEVCEWYSLNISANLIKFANILTGWMPFSLFEILIYLAVALGVSFLIFIIVALCRKQFKRAFNSFVDFALIVVLVGTIYGVFAILPYGRAPADIPAYENSNLQSEQVYEMTEGYIEELSRLAKIQKRADNGELVIEGGLQGLNESLQTTYERVLTSDFYYDTDSTLKKWLWPELMSAFSISGVFFAPTGECNVCTAYYTTTTVAAAAHEMAHSKGVQRESDANLVSYYIMLNSEDNLVKYVGYYTLVGNMLAFVHTWCGEGAYDSLWDKLPEEYFADAEFAAAYSSGQGALGSVGSFFNDIYLQLNGTEDGTGDYHPSDETITEEVPDGDGGTQIVTRIEYSDVNKMLLYMFYSE